MPRETPQGPSGLLPCDGPRPGANAAETKVYEALRRHLPAGLRAWHSVRLRIAGRWEGEADFVIADPARGLVVLEVKGGRVEIAGGRWLQNGQPMDCAPRDQAQRFARNLVDEIERRGGGRPRFEFACAFPDTEFSAGPTAGDVHGLVLGARDLAWLADVLPGFLDRALGDTRPARGFTAAIDEIWGRTWVPRVSLADQVADAARRRVALDEEQLRVLEMALDNPRAYVAGGAGTGKTLLARERVLRASEDGLRALYLCFTDALAGAVASAITREGPRAARASAVAVRRLAARLTGDAPASPDKTFWDAVSLRAAEIVGPTERPDLVVVDEAQDFEDGDWLLVEALAGAGPLWIFGDERQRFWTDRDVPARFLDGAARVRLPRQHRNPPGVEAFAALYVAGASPAPAALPEGVRVVVAADPLDRVRHEIDVLRKDGARPQDIVVLSLAGRGRSHLLELKNLGSHRLARADDPAAASSVIADTFLRFKGLDRPFVLVTEPVHGANMRYDTRMHIALTRATASVIVVVDPDGAAKDPRLTPMQG